MPLKEEDFQPAPDPVEEDSDDHVCGLQDYWNEEDQEYQMMGVNISDYVNGAEEWPEYLAIILRQVYPEQCWHLLGITQPSNVDPTPEEEPGIDHDVIVDTGNQVLTNSPDLGKLGMFMDLFGVQANQGGLLGEVMGYLGGYYRHGGTIS